MITHACKCSWASCVQCGVQCRGINRIKNRIKVSEVHNMVRPKNGPNSRKCCPNFPCSISALHICLSRFWLWAKYFLSFSHLFSMIIIIIMRRMHLMRWFVRASVSFLFSDYFFDWMKTILAHLIVIHVTYVTNTCIIIQFSVLN